MRNCRFSFGSARHVSPALKKGETVGYYRCSVAVHCIMAYERVTVDKRPHGMNLYNATQQALLRQPLKLMAETAGIASLTARV